MAPQLGRGIHHGALSRDNPGLSSADAAHDCQGGEYVKLGNFRAVSAGDDSCQSEHQRTTCHYHTRDLPRTNSISCDVDHVTFECRSIQDRKVVHDGAQLGELCDYNARQQTSTLILTRSSLVRRNADLPYILEDHIHRMLSRSTSQQSIFVG